MRTLSVVTFMLAAAFTLCAAPAVQETDMPPAYRTWGNTLDYPSPQSPVSMQYMNAYDIDKNGFVFINDGHFYTAAGRIRFIGMNFSFETMFPEARDAERIAAHLAGLGINCVRIHHIDLRDIWGKYKDTQEQFDEAQLDRMDYFVAQLKKRGVYVNLNLHVSRKYPSTKDYDYRKVMTDPSFLYGKGIDTFMPELIEMQKQYATALLNHVNKYTGLAYKDDPVMAMLEINNENSFYRGTFYYNAMDKLPENFREVIRKKWNAFLSRKYSSTDTSDLPDKKTLPTLMPLKQQDFIAFIHDTERAYWNEMVAFVKKAGVRVPVTGTQLEFSFLDLGDCYDYVDTHAYWRHPSFPGKSWDMANFYVRNESMLGYEKNTITAELVTDRIAGKPYTVSEYDHPYPNEYCAEGVPFIAVNAALQDYDAFFFFTFGASDGSIRFFDYFNNFAKKHLLPFAAAAFRSGKVAPLSNAVLLTINRGDMLTAALAKTRNPFRELLTVPMITGSRIGVAVTDGEALSPDKEVQSKKAAPEARFAWNCSTNDYRSSYLKLDERTVKLYMGFSAGTEVYSFSGMTLSKVESPGGNFIFSAFNRDGAIGDRGTYIVTLASRNRYSGVEYLDYSKKQPLPAGDNHGLRVMAASKTKNNVEYIECLGGTVTMALPAAAQAVCYGIGNTGMKSSDVPVSVNGNSISFTIDPSYNTIVYVLEVR
ncbi:MAG: cellulase family glycosylhydrolase [Spirochaetes bacterium]|nr:cellulase family glycosylhydrolase [Spirochaetota bacterium]